MIFKAEGQCQNWASDSGNKFNGKIGYTCMGQNVVTIEMESFLHSLKVTLVVQKNSTSMVMIRTELSINNVLPNCILRNYFTPAGCNDLPQPAFYVCSDIAVNSGVGRSKQYLAELGGYSGQGAKTFARQLNDKQRQDYIKWGCPTCKNHVFLKGWQELTCETSIVLIMLIKAPII